MSNDKLAATFGDRGVKLTAGDIERIRREGFEEGLKKGRLEIVDWLEHAYIRDEGRPDRGTPKAEAILELARAASLHFVARTNGNGKKRK